MTKRYFLCPSDDTCIPLSDKAVVITAQNLGSPHFKIPEEDISFWLIPDEQIPSPRHDPPQIPHLSETPRMLVVPESWIFYANYSRDNEIKQKRP